MKIIKILADMRIKWYGRDGKLKFKTYKPYKKLPILEEPQAIKFIESENFSSPATEELEGYYYISEEGKIVKSS